MEPLDQPIQQPQPLPSPPLTFKNRRTWLIVFGVLEIFIAFFFVGMGMLMVAMPQDALTQAQVRQQPGAPQFSTLSLAAIYAAIASIWLVVAIGTMMAKNWARIVSLVLSYFWLACGVLGTLVTAFILPEIVKQQPKAESASNGFVLAFTLTIMIVLMVIVPGIFLLFFHNKNVRCTCESTSANISTRRPALIYAVMALFAFTLLGGPFTIFGAYPILVFGTLVWGLSKVLIMVVYMGAEAFALWGYVKADLRGWWAGLIITVLWALSALVTLARGNFAALHERMGFGANTRMFQGKILVLTLVFGLVYVLCKLAAILYSRQYFPLSSSLHSEPA